MGGIKGILFDLYGTLYDVHSVVERCEELFPGRGGEISALWRQKQLEYMWLRGLMERYRPFERLAQDALAYTCSRLGLSLSATARATLCEAYLTLDPFPETAPALLALRSIGVPLGILSNGSAHGIDRVVRHSGFRQHFEHLVSTERAQVFKPQPAAYELGEQAFGVTRDSILFVSANALDAAGARSFGYAVAWVNRSCSPFEELEGRPDVEVTSLGAVAEWVREHHAPRHGASQTAAPDRHSIPPGR